MAFAHYKIASAIEHKFREDAIESINALKSKMTPSEIQQGEQEAEKLMREYGLE